MYQNDIVWHVGIRKRQEGMLDDSAVFHIIRNPKGRWAADPFLFSEQGKTYIFVELYCNKIHRGCIAVCEIKENDITPYRIIIEEEYHMSYPYIWRDCDGIHLCAETGDNKSLHFYKPTDFPFKWEKEKVLMKGKRWADTTFLHDASGKPIYGLTYEYDDSWQAEMKVFQILDDKIEVSKEKPIVTRQIQRCGGMFISDDEKRYRVAQNGEPSYGHNLIFCEAKLDWPHYREKIVKEVELESIKYDGKFKAIGMHTYNATDMYEVIDFRSHEFHFDTFIYGCYKRFRTLGGKVKRKIMGEISR